MEILINKTRDPLVFSKNYTLDRLDFQIVKLKKKGPHFSKNQFTLDRMRILCLYVYLFRNSSFFY